ncbi:hypothetical protein ACFLY3_05090 [Chloroflexota bacterium]
MKTILLCLLLLVTLILSSCISERLVTQTIPVTQTITQTQVVTVAMQPITVTVTPTTTQPQEEYEIIEAKYKITEKNSIYWTFSWQATIKNNTSGQLHLSVQILFVDNEGFVLGNSVTQYLNLEPGEQETIKFYWFVDAALAPDVVAMELEIE